MKMLTFCLSSVVIAIGMQLGVGAQVYASPYWDLTGTYIFQDNYGYQSSVTVDTMNLQTGEFSGTGYLIGWDPSWSNVFSGIETRNTFTMDVTFPALALWGTETGTIYDDGSISVYWVDCYGNTSVGWTIEGHATPIASPVPIPGAVWILGSVMLCLFGLKKKKQ